MEDIIAKIQVLYITLTGSATPPENLSHRMFSVKTLESKTPVQIDSQLSFMNHPDEENWNYTFIF